MGEQMAAHTRSAAELMVHYGQAEQVRLTGQASVTRERLASCIDGLTRAGDPKTASQVSASYLSDTVKTYTEDLQSSRLLTQAHRCALGSIPRRAKLGA
jgi:hypothetical protein